MGASFDPMGAAVVWIADTGLFVACGRQQNNKYTALERFAQRNGISFVIPQRAYGELGGTPNRSTPGQPPINSAIDAGWVRVAERPDYTDGTVSRVMDDVRTFIAQSSNRREDQIEKADTALAAVAAERLAVGDGESACIVTTDIDAGEAIVSALSRNGVRRSCTIRKRLRVDRADYLNRSWLLVVLVVAPLFVEKHADVTSGRVESGCVDPAFEIPVSSLRGDVAFFNGSH